MQIPRHFVAGLHAGNGGIADKEQLALRDADIAIFAYHRDEPRKRVGGKAGQPLLFAA